MTIFRFALASAWLLSSVGCAQDNIDASRELPVLDENFFRCEVQPVLAVGCAFMDCHGNAERPLSIYAEQRFRLGISWDDFELPITSEELAANYRTVLGFIGQDNAAGDLLSEKPLDTRAGGLFHRGRDLYGNDDVFLSTDDPGYVALRNFISGATAEQSCAPREDLRQ